MATATKAKSQKASKPAKATKASKPTKPTKQQPASKPTKKETAPAKKEFGMTQEQKDASDEKFYATLVSHGVAVDNPRSGKRLGRFILQAHCLAQVWPAKPMTPAEIAAACSKRFGISVTENRVRRQLIDELRCQRVRQIGKDKFQKTGTTANYWSLASEE